jgi:hypothetical protein
MRRVLFAGVAAAMLAGGSLAAHHSYSAYHTDLVIQIDGRLETFEWVNPHSLLKIRTADASYTVEWRAPNAMLRTGIDKDWLKVGDRLIVTGNPRRDLAESGVVNLKTVQRPSDGWAWPSR